MALALNNAQGEISDLERGIHALNSPLSVRDYARAVSISATAIAYQRHAAEVFTRVNTDADLSKMARHLAELHQAPRWLWRSLVSRLASEGWTVEQARGAAQKFKDTPEPPRRPPRLLVSRGAHSSGTPCRLPPLP
jgi:hypothetical protein